MLLPILSRQVTPALNDAASQLGIAMQITNILRDVGEDLRDRGRIYLPLDLMQRYHVTDKMLAAGKVTANSPCCGSICAGKRNPAMTGSSVS
jgi:phytoene synthase